jgi:outer membrane receptor protein involved in Fe transport
MKRLTVRSCALVGTAVLCLASVLRINAQTTAPASSAASLENEETLVLSPFVVSAEEDAGSYKATSTLAGSRIRTELRDVASPISVVTSQFLQDTASNNNQDLLTYTTNTEVGGLFGNWGGFGNGQGASDRSSLLQPNNNTRVRGLEAADNTRNFFLTDIPWDSYNTDRVEIQRGPNSILFGVGSPAGIINANTIQARFSGNSGKVESQVSSHSSARWVIDYNAELIDDLLAVRVAGLASFQKFRQEPAFNDDKRIFATASFEPQVFPSSWAGKLSVRATMETASIEANRPRMLPPEDGITLWFDDAAGDGVNNKVGLGKAVVDMFLYNQGGGGDPFRGPLSSSTVLNPFYLPGTAALDGGALNNGGIGFWFKNGSSQPFFVSRQAPRAFPGGLNASGGVDNAIDIPYGSALRVSGLNQYSIQIDRIDTTEGQVSRYPLASRNYYKDQSLTDPTIFDFYNHLIDGDNKREYQEWDSSNLTVAQTFLNNRLGLEFVYDTQDYSEWRGGSAWDRPYISIDINKNFQNQLTQYTRNSADRLDPSTYSVYGFTPTAAQPYANPMAGAAFIAGSFSNNNRVDRERDTTRLTGFGELRADDFLQRDSMLARILGRHVFTGLLTREKRHEAQTIWAPSATPYEWARGLSVSGENTNLGESPRGITPIIYLSDPLFGRTSASGLNLGPIDTYYNPSGIYQVDHFKTQWIATGVDPGAPWTNLLGGVGVQADNPFNYRGRINSPVGILNADNGRGEWSQLVTNHDVTDQIIDSTGFVWQGHLFGGHIVPTVGWREDTLETYTGSGEKLNGVASTSVDETEQVLENTGRTKSWGLVAHMPSKWLENAPVISGLSAYYNYGENNKVEARYNYDGEPLVNPSAESVDYGIVINAFKDKLTLKAGHFKTKVKDGNLPGGASLIGGNQYYLYNLEAWGTANALMYLFGRAGLDPNQSWHWNWALVDDNAWGNENGTYAPSTALFQNHPSSVKQAAAIDAWFAGLDEQFFKNYDIGADVPALKTAYNTFKSSGNIAPLIAAAQASGFAVGTYTTGFSSRNDGKINGISPNGTIDNTSEGYEVELNWQPVSQWNIQINAAKVDAYRENLGAPMLAYIEQQWARMQGPAGDIRLWWGGDSTLRKVYDDNIISAVKFQEESVGFQVPELRPWRVGVITNYNFTEGRAKGFNVGGAARWENEQILGYRLKDDKTGLDVTKPILGDKEQHLDLWVGYDRKLSEKVKWRIQLNLRNVGESKGLVPISANPDGTIAVQRITEGMSWSLTNTFSF